MKTKEIQQFYSNVAQAIADLGLAIDHFERSNDARRYRRGVDTIAQEARFAEQCAANGCDIAHLLHGQLEKIAAAADAKVLSSRRRKARAAGS